MLLFIQNRPPLIVIFFCILTAAFTLTYFAFYIKSTNFVLDNDVIYDWNQLLKHFNDLEGCIDNETDITLKKNEETAAGDIKSINTIISVSSSEISFSEISGSLILEGWHPVCDNSNPSPEAFQIAFNVPKTNLTNFEACASISGPERFFPTFSKPVCNTTYLPGNKDVGKLSTTKKVFKEFCRNGMRAKLTFLWTNKNNFANYLNTERKNITYIHLLWTVYFLFGVLIIILVYAFLESKQHVKYMEKCSNLIQKH